MNNQILRIKRFNKRGRGGGSRSPVTPGSKNISFTLTQGKLRQHIHNPNAAELVHYLFVPLSLLIRCTGG